MLADLRNNPVVVFINPVFGSYDKHPEQIYIKT